MTSLLKPIDLKILKELTLNSRQNLSTVSKKLKISRQLLEYKIRKLENEEVILKYTIYTQIERGRKPNSLVLVKSKNKDEIIKNLEKKYFVYNKFYCIGKYDAVLWLSGKIDEKYDGVTVYDTNEKYYTNPLSEKELSTIKKSKNEHKLKLDSKDFILLKELKNNSKMTILDLSKKTGFARETIQKRILNYKKSNDVHFSLIINKKKLGQKLFILFIQGNNLQNLFDFFKEDYHVRYMIKYDSILNVELFFNDNLEFYNFLENLRNKYSDYEIEPLVVIKGMKKMSRGSNYIVTS